MAEQSFIFDANEENDEYEAAILQLLELLKRDRHFKDAVARKGLTAVFNMLGGDHELVVKYRKQMMNLMF